ncbi:hypothetical protein GCM10027035_32280 [Emticicia sediminis]
MLFFTSISGRTQTYNHTSVWSRFLLSKQFGKFIVSGDAAYRRQNNFHHSKFNFLQNPFLDAQRLTVGYRSKDWLFSFAASRWHAYQILGKEADFERLPTVEWRFTPGIEYFRKINKGTLQWRTQYEYRTFTDRTAGRFRQRFQYRLPVSPTNNLVFLQEFLFGSPPNSTKKYEQNQLGVTFNHNFTDKLESEIGYRYIFRRRRTSDEIDNENALVIGLMLRL